MEHLAKGLCRRIGNDHATPIWFHPWVPNGVLRLEPRLDATFVSFSMNNNNASIQILTGSNYKKWKRDVDFSLEIMDLDLCMREDQPGAPTNASTVAQRNLHAQWEKSNRLNIIAMKRSSPKHLLSGLPKTTNAKEFLTNVGKLYETGENAKIGSLMDENQTIKYDETKRVRDFILKIVNVQSKLKDRKIPLPGSYIIHHALNALPTSFSLIKIAYKTYNQTWSINDLILKCVAKENKLKREKNESAHYVS
ncbi:uncharacterized protein LOC133785776 [Humulus lupulus]|uniref:uncharacterized protein LOC133785776 n=1 Tax=Humulus lupulus TaxID=3486 RepID=UPI002B40A8A5|nr:uncharacterized protein LOC133785776 [Humulus lupulus]